jgi:hypothetical protein
MELDTIADRVDGMFERIGVEGGAIREIRLTVGDGKEFEAARRNAICWGIPPRYRGVPIYMSLSRSYVVIEL